MMNKSLPWLTLSLVTVLSVSVFIYFKRTYFLSTEDVALFDNAEALQAAFHQTNFFDRAKYNQNKVRVVYFWQAYCPCDATVLPHYRDMIKKYSDQAVDFFFVDLSKNNTSHSLPLDRNRQLGSDIAGELRGLVPYTPSVAIWDKEGTLSYYGPHNLGFVCNAQTSFVKKVIDSLFDGSISRNINTLGEGCFCR